MNTNATKMKNILASCFISEDPSFNENTHLCRWADFQKPYQHKDGLAYSAHSLILQNPPFRQI